MFGWGSCGYEPRIEDIIKLKKSGRYGGGFQSGGQVRVGVGRGFDECEPRTESIVKRA